MEITEETLNKAAKVIDAEKQLLWDCRYLLIARLFASCSYALRLKVGVVLVKDRRIISTGYNGTAPGDRNVCEQAVKPDGIADDRFNSMVDEEVRAHLLELNQHAGYNLRTLPTVIHAEANAILKVAESHETSQGSTLYITHNPCFECSKMILGAGIVRVVYENRYRAAQGVAFLRSNGIKVDQIPTIEVNRQLNKVLRPNKINIREYGR